MSLTTSSTDFWAEITNFLLPLKHFFTNDRLDLFFKDVDLNYLINALFWTFLVYAVGFAGFNKIFQILLKNTNIKYFKRKQFARSAWNLCFYVACTMFLYAYNEFILLPQISKNQVYSLLIVTFYLHGVILDLKETDYLEAVSKALLLLSLVTILYYNYENYFVGLNLVLDLYHIFTECILLVALQTSERTILVHQFFLVLRIISWTNVFVNLLPFKYLVPTLFAKNFKVILNLFIWFWYGVSIWNSPVLQFFYHQIYHTMPQECSGEGSAAKCILLKDSNEHRHFKTLKKAYIEVKLAHEKVNANTLSRNTTNDSSSSAKAFQAIKCIMTLKRKLKRIRECRSADVEEEIDDMSVE